MATENMPENIPAVAELEWCDDRATSLSHGSDDEAYEILHQCRHENGHEGYEHSCWLCTFVWYSEVTC